MTRQFIGEEIHRNLFEGQADLVGDLWTFLSEISFHRIHFRCPWNLFVSVNVINWAFRKLFANQIHFCNPTSHEFVIKLCSELIYFLFTLFLYHDYQLSETTANSRDLRINRGKCRWNNVRDLRVLMLESWRTFLLFWSIKKRWGVIIYDVMRFESIWWAVKSIRSVIFGFFIHFLPFFQFIFHKLLKFIKFKPSLTPLFLSFMKTALNFFLS